MFPTTRWTLIFELKGGEQASKEVAMEELCQRYWLPVYAYVRRKCQQREQAEDLTQGFFEKLISGSQLQRAEEARGKLRAFMLKCLENYLNSEWRRSASQKRGGGFQRIAIDAEHAESLLVSVDLSPTQAYDQAWALALIQSVNEILEQEYLARGKPEQFAILRDYLAWNARSRSYADGAAELGISEAALKQAVRRLRQRFGLLLRRQLEHATETETQVEEEIRSLFAAFRRES